MEPYSYWVDFCQNVPQSGFLHIVLTNKQMVGKVYACNQMRPLYNCHCHIAVPRFVNTNIRNIMKIQYFMNKQRMQ